MCNSTKKERKLLHNKVFFSCTACISSEISVNYWRISFLSSTYSTYLTWSL